jgi:hypothetical protein
MVRMRLLIVRDDGTVVRRVGRQSRGGGSRSSTMRPPSPPEWAEPRSPKGPIDPNAMSRTCSMGIGCGPGDPRATDVESDADGWYDLGTHVERGRNNAADWRVAYFPDGCNDIDLRADDTIAEDSTFVAPAVRTQRLFDHLIGSDGKPIDPKKAGGEIWCDAVRFPWIPPADAWRTVPVRVRAYVPGYRLLEFDWTAATADEPRVLVANSSK